MPLLLALLLQIEGIQNFAVDRAARLASRKLGTEVRIERLSVGFFNRVRIDGFYVADLQHDTLLYAGRSRLRSPAWGWGVCWRSGRRC